MILKIYSITKYLMVISKIHKRANHNVFTLVSFYNALVLKHIHIKWIILLGHKVSIPYGEYSLIIISAQYQAILKKKK